MDSAMRMHKVEKRVNKVPYPYVEDATCWFGIPRRERTGSLDDHHCRLWASNHGTIQWVIVIVLDELRL